MTTPTATVLVTGGTGFIGLNLVEALLDAGAYVASFDARPPMPLAAARLGARSGFLGWLQGDARDVSAVRAALRETGAEAMVHGAAITADEARERAEPDRIVSVNIGGVVATLTAAHEVGLRRTVMISTAAVYGDTASEMAVLDEDAPKRPRSLYAVTKSAAEDAALRLAALGGCPVRIARLGWIFGRWEHHSGVRDTVSRLHDLTHAALTGRPAPSGSDAPRDWAPAPAVAAALVRLLMAETTSHSVYNLGVERRWSASEWSDALARRLPGAPTADRSGAAGSASDGVLSAYRFAAEFGPVSQSTLEAEVDAYLSWIRASRMENVS